MAKLADAHGSGPCGSNPMGVQLSLSALIKVKVKIKNDISKLKF